ncbi:MAG: hypothetical protein IMX00_04705 [Limnochordales bacterium]|nr:hypothetical protein [Limnochordales bacterium]
MLKISEGGRIHIQLHGLRPANWDVRIGSWTPRSPLLKFLVGSFSALVAGLIVVLVLAGVVAPVVGLALLVALMAIVFALGVSVAVLLVPLLIVVAPIALLAWLISLVL